MDKALPSLIGSLAVFAGVVGVSLLIFVLMREVWTWYWKINAALVELRAVRGLLEHISLQIGQHQPQPAPRPPPLPRP